MIDMFLQRIPPRAWSDPRCPPSDSHGRNGRRSARCAHADIPLRNQAYQGFVYADAKTLGVVRIEMQVPVADIPKHSEYLKVGLTLDYKPEQVAGRAFLLPAHYALVYQMRSGKATYLASYTSYRKFSADATIQFEGDKNQ